MSAARPLPHYLPAAFIGGFGIPNPRRTGGRYASVCMRRRNAETVMGPLPAEKVAAEFGLYDVERPTPSLPADFADKLWEQYEGALPAAAVALESDGFTAQHWETVLLHVQAQSIRHPDFDRVASAHLGAGVPRDAIQEQRQVTHRESRRLLSRARFAVVRRSSHAPRFLLNDKGLTSFLDLEFGARSVLFPLTGNVAVLMAVDAAREGDDYEAGPYAVRRLNPKALRFVNGASWDQVHTRAVFGHPDDEQTLAGLRSTGQLARLPLLGPYQGNREPGLLDWAFAYAEIRILRERWLAGLGLSPST